MKIYINRAPINGPWGGGNAWVTAFYQYCHSLKCDIVPIKFSYGTPDVIMLASLQSDDQHIDVARAVASKKYLNSIGCGTKLVLRVNENDARKNTNYVDKELLEAFHQMDGVIFVSNWLQQYFKERGRHNTRDCVIVNGVDRETFQPQQKLNNNKVNIVTHSWSNNVLKGFDIYEKLDEFVGLNSAYTFTYIGRDRGTFKHTNVIKPLFGKELGKELGKYDVYVSASRADPGPNHILESISAGLPTYVHACGGGCVEFAGYEHVYNNWNELEMLLVSKKFSLNLVQLRDWKSCIQDYVNYCEQLQNTH